jgi:hypothetical protein
MLLIKLPKRSTRRIWPWDVEVLHRARRSAKRGEIDPLGQPGGCGRKAIPPLEGAADGRTPVLPLGQLDDPLGGVFVQNRGQHAIIGRHEAIVAGVGRDAAARRADAGVDDHQEDGAGRKIAVRCGEFERAAEHIMRGHVVRDVDERRVGANPQRHTLHRAGVVIARAKVGEQGDDRARHRSSLPKCRGVLLSDGRMPERSGL